MAPKAAKTDLEQYQEDFEDFERQASETQCSLYQLLTASLARRNQPAARAATRR